jgi:tetratricopeptide (TPR) repeat protein
VKELSLQNLISISKGYFGWFRWIPMVTFAFNHYMGDNNPVIFHVTNIIIHTLCFLSVFYLIYQLMKSGDRTGPDRVALSPFYYAIFAAGIWALHPVQTNAVTYVVQRMASIHALFYTLSISLYIKGRMKHREKGSWRAGTPWYAGCSIGALCAFLSKENSAMLPFMLIMTEMWFFQPGLHWCFWNNLKKSHWIRWVLAATAFFLLAFVFFLKFQELLASYGGRHFTMQERLLTQARVVVWYISILLWPAPSRLSIEHDVTLSTSLFHPPTTLLCILFLAILLWLTFHFRKRFPLITYGSLWFFLNLLIESTIVPLELIFEHRLYLPSAVFFLSLAIVATGGLRVTFPKVSEHDFLTLVKCGFAVVMAALTLLTFLRNEAWENALTLYSDATAKSPHHPRSHANLAVALYRFGFYEEAIKEGEETIRLGKEHMEQYAIAAHMIVAAHVQRENFEEAVRRADELLSNQPKDIDATAIPHTYYFKSLAHRKLGQLKEAFLTSLITLSYFQNLEQSGAVFYFQKKLLAENAIKPILEDCATMDMDINGDGKPDPGDFPIHLWLATEFLRQGERQIAGELAQKALSEAPEDLRSRSFLEAIQQEDQMNQIQTAKGDLSSKYIHNPFSPFNFHMAMAFWIRKNHSNILPLSLGEFFLDRALKLGPEEADAHLLDGWYHFEKSETQEAIAAVDQVLKLDPDYAKAWLGAGFFLAKANQKEEAIQAFRKALELYPGCPQRLAILDIIRQLTE